ncbi:MAG: D-glycero-beta-D-manno-heptose 1,7-bisphosphate 7-phosphatase [Campylobacterales bacterium]|nr:D-glycero-beta-D-manno-heptose 1,7-bisphosphate 7-phosphatase [Campylobacterales bacterium]
MSKTTNKALFLDRDGVINVDYDYVHKVEKFEFIDGIFELCRYYQNLDFMIFVITNQSGISRGYYSEEAFTQLSLWMVEEFAKHNIEIKKVYHCPHHPETTGDCSCRKPQAGMLLDAQEEFDIDLENSVLVGDNERDIESGLKAGLHETYLFDVSNSAKNSKASRIVSKLEDIWKNRC